jgi:hypothetical protein
MDGTGPQQQIISFCESEFASHIADCSGFAKAVANDLGIVLTGMANDIVDQIQTLPWTVLADGIDAKSKADLGNFVIGGLKDDPHGHVVVVVQGPLDPGHQKYPTAYWGSIRGAQFAAKDKTVNWAWDSTERDKVIYASLSISSS